MSDSELIENLAKFIKEGSICKLVSGNVPSVIYKDGEYTNQIDSYRAVNLIYELYQKYPYLEVAKYFELDLKQAISEAFWTTTLYNILMVFSMHRYLSQIGEAPFQINNENVLASFREKIEKEKEFYKTVESSLKEDNKVFYDTLVELDQSDLENGLHLS